MASADSEHQIDLQNNSEDNAPTPAGGKPRPEDALKTESGDIAPEVKKAQKGDELTDEEYEKIEARLEAIISSGLQSIKPILKMIKESCDEAESKQKNNSLNEEAFIDKMKPLIHEAQGVLESTLNQVEAIDPEKKLQQRAKRANEDQEATPQQKKIAEGLAKLTEEVTQTIEHAKDKIKNMPKAKSELGPLFSLLSKPLFQILSAVGLLVYGVLNLVGNILDALGLGGIVSGIMNGLGITSIMKSLGWKLQLVKHDDNDDKK